MKHKTAVTMILGTMIVLMMTGTGMMGIRMIREQTAREILMSYDSDATARDIMAGRQ